MTNVVSALTARTQLGQIIKRATEKNERFVVARRGEPAVIIMSVKDYIDTMAPAPPELKAMQQQAKKTGLNTLSMRQIDSIIAEMRGEQAPRKKTKRQRK